MKKEIVPKLAGSLNGGQKENKEKNPNAAFVMPVIQVFHSLNSKVFLPFAVFFKN